MKGIKVAIDVIMVMVLSQMVAFSDEFILKTIYFLGAVYFALHILITSISELNEVESTEEEKVNKENNTELSLEKTDELNTNEEYENEKE